MCGAYLEGLVFMRHVSSRASALRIRVWRLWGNKFKGVSLRDEKLIPRPARSRLRIQVSGATVLVLGCGICGGRIGRIGRRVQVCILNISVYRVVLTEAGKRHNRE